MHFHCKQRKKATTTVKAKREKKTKTQNKDGDEQLRNSISMEQDLGY